LASQCHLEVSRKEIASVSYFPAWEIQNKSRSEWVKHVFIPALLPVVRRKNVKIIDIPITFWVGIRTTARVPAGEIFVFQTPVYPGTVIKNAISAALHEIKGGMVFAGAELIPGEALPVCQVFRNQLIRFYYTLDGLNEYYLPAFKWSGCCLYFTLAEIKKSKLDLKNKNSEIIYVQSINRDDIDGKQLRLFQMARRRIGCTDETTTN